MPLGFSFSPDGRLALTYVNGYGYNICDLGTGKAVFNFSLGGTDRRRHLGQRQPAPGRDAWRPGWSTSCGWARPTNGKL